MIEFFKIILYEPLLNLLVVFYNLIPGHDLGIAIIILTLVLKLLLFPLSRQSIKSQKGLKELQPKLEELKKKYVNQKDKQAQAMMSLYKENKVDFSESESRKWIIYDNQKALNDGSVLNYEAILIGGSGSYRNKKGEMVRFSQFDGDSQQLRCAFETEYAHSLKST